MVGSERLFADRQGPLMDRLGLLVEALGVVGQAQGVEVVRRRGMARPEIALGELRGAQGERQGLLVVAE